MRRVVFALWLLGLTTTTIVAAVAADWKTIITAEDRDRLDRLAESISKGDATAAASNPAPADTNVLRAILDPPDGPVAVDRLAGNWRCRTVKVGHILVVYSWFKCRIAATAEGLRLEKISGSQRLSGTLYSDGPTRLILLGAGTVNDDPPVPYSALAGEGAAADPDADMVGVVTQPAPDRLRIVFPFPHYESIYDVMELKR
jgi:Domain of unknown function (DUF4893)